MCAQTSSAGLQNISLYLSLKAKLRAWVGKYLRMLAVFPGLAFNKPVDIPFVLTSPECESSLLLVHTDGTIYDALVGIGDLSGSSLHLPHRVSRLLSPDLSSNLEEELDALNGCNRSLGDSSRNS